MVFIEKRGAEFPEKTLSTASDRRPREDILTEASSALSFVSLFSQKLHCRLCNLVFLSPEKMVCSLDRDERLGLGQLSE